MSNDFKVRYDPASGKACVDPPACLRRKKFVSTPIDVFVELVDYRRRILNDVTLLLVLGHEGIASLDDALQQLKALDRRRMEDTIKIVAERAAAARAKQ